MLFSASSFGEKWQYASTTDPLTDDVMTLAIGFDLDFKYTNDYTIGFQCIDNEVRFTIDTETLIQGKNSEFKFSYRVDKKSPSTIWLKTYSNNNQGGYTIEHATDIAKNIIGGSSIFVRAIGWDDDYLQTTISLRGSDVAIQRVFKDCGIDLEIPKSTKKAGDGSGSFIDAEIDSEKNQGEAKTAMTMAVGAIYAAVVSNWIQPQTSTIGLRVVIRININPGGEVTSARVVKSSGNALFDRSSEIAVLKASPLPVPNNPRYYQHIKEFDFAFAPNG